MKGKGDVITGVVVLLFCSFWFKLVADLPDKVDTAAFGSEFFPRLVLILIVIFSIVLIIIGLRDMKKTNKTSLEINQALITRMVLFVVLLISYAFLFTKIGFLFSTIIFMILGQRIFGIRKLSWIGISTILVSFGFYYVFTLLFKVPLP